MLYKHVDVFVLIQQVCKYLSADSVDQKPKSRSTSVHIVCLLYSVDCILVL